MRLSKLHPFSALLGAVLAILGLIFVSWGSSGADTLRVELGPDPDRHVRILEGADYVVPHGRTLTLTTFTSSGLNTGDFLVKINGQSFFLAPGSGSSFDPFTELAQGITARAGEVVTLEQTFPFPDSDPGVALGFLSPASSHHNGHGR